MFASIVVPVVIFAILLSKMPETPRWLSERRRFEEARNILVRINGAQEGQSEFNGINAEIEKKTHTPQVALAWISHK